MATDNYGGILQTYALQRYLKNEGHEAYVIRYSRSSKVPIIAVIKKVVYNILNIRYYIYNRKCRRQAEKWAAIRSFQSFAKNNISFSEQHYTSFKQIKNDPPVADAYITGSDQVWCFDINNVENRPFFLDFGDPKTVKLSYAASFGHDSFPCKNEMLFKQILSNFKQVSVREDSGVEICKQMGIKAIRCVDSTMLLDCDHYRSLIHNKKNRNPFVFLYTVNITEPEEVYWTDILKFTKERGIECIVTTGSGYIPAKEIFPDAIYDYSTVEEWLSNIYNSDIVVTASFHGIVFSIIFHKNFIYVPLKSRLSTGNSRVLDLLSSCGLNSRIAYSSAEMVSLLNTRIDYSKVNMDFFLKLREDSINFLKQSLLS